MKSIFYGFCVLLVVVCGFTFYLARQGTPVANATGSLIAQSSRMPNQNSSLSSVSEPKTTTPNKKKCACCREKLARLRKAAKQKIQARKAWAREIFANYGYEEGMKRIAAKDPGVAKQIQQILERDRQPNLAPTVAQSSSQ